MELREQLRAFFREKQRVGVVELVLVLVVFIGLVIIFKKQIITLSKDISKEVNSRSKKVY